MTNNNIVDNDLKYFVENFPFTEEIAGKTILVTGATGLIGSILIKCLLKLNEVAHARIRILGMARNREKVERIFGTTLVTWMYQDILADVTTSESPHYIIHCANPTNSKYYVDNPVETINIAYIGTNQLLRFAHKVHIESMVYLSSLESYGTVLQEREIDEKDSGFIDPLDVRSSYSLGKKAAECLCHAYNAEYAVPIKIARLTQIFGAGISLDDNRVFAQFAKNIVQKKNIVLHTVGASAKPYCYTIDAIMAIFYILLKGKNGLAYNVANPDTYISIRDMAQMIAATFGFGRVNVVTEIRTDMGYAPTTKLKLKATQLESLGWKPHFPLQEMFQRLIDYYKTIM